MSTDVDTEVDNTGHPKTGVLETDSPAITSITPKPEPEEIQLPGAVAPEPEPEEPEEKVEASEPLLEDVINIIEPKIEPVDVVLTYGGATAIYTQKPLTYFRKMEFFGLLGETLDEAMEGESGLTVNAILGGSSDFAGSFNDLDSFMGLAAKVAHYVPNFLRESYLVLLNVPKNERAWAREALDDLDDEEGVAIAERFIDQNYEAIERFFRERVPALAERVRAQMDKPKV